MFSKPTGETFITTQKVVLDVEANHIETIYPGQDPFQVIGHTMWVGRGSTFQFCNMVETKEVIKFAPAGTTLLLSEAYRRIGEPNFEVLETWRWTGRKWQQVVN